MTVNNKIKVEDIVDSISNTHKFDKEKLYFLNTSDILEGEIIQAHYTCISELKGQAKKTIKNGDILFSEIRPKNKRFCLIDFDETDDYVVSTKLMVLRNKNTLVNNKYFYYKITSQEMLAYLQKMAESRIGSFPQITFDVLKKIEIEVPDYEYQQMVVEKIELIDNKIKLNNKLKKSLEEYCSLMFYRWFVEFNFPNKDLKPYKLFNGVFSEVDNNKIPEGWEIKSLNEIVEILTNNINPQKEPKKLYKHYSIPVFDDIKTYREELGESILSNKYLVTSSNLLVSKLNPWFKRIVYPIGIDEAICSTEFVVWQPKKDNLLEYLYVVANSERFTTYCTNASSGTSNSHKRVNPKFMMKYKVPYNEEIVFRFNEMVKPMVKKINLLLIENKKLKEARDLLIKKLIK
ncbi:TPA: restriction endonuclease subunit S [Clostridium perfringens]|uniref:restriction endonuclease subunit S n=1 Tax=Clostridium perfringens TaxID=1502 RepID=UPI003AFFC821